MSRRRLIREQLQKHLNECDVLIRVPKANGKEPTLGTPSTLRLGVIGSVLNSRNKSRVTSDANYFQSRGKVSISFVADDEVLYSISKEFVTDDLLRITKELQQSNFAVVTKTKGNITFKAMLAEILTCDSSFLRTFVKQQYDAINPNSDSS